MDGQDKGTQDLTSQTLMCSQTRLGSQTRIWVRFLNREGKANSACRANSVDSNNSEGSNSSEVKRWVSDNRNQSEIQEWEEIWVIILTPFFNYLGNYNYRQQNFQGYQMQNYNFNLQQIETYAQQIFVMHDRDRSGSLDMMEFPVMCQSFFRQMGLQAPSQMDVMFLMNTFD